MKNKEKRVLKFKNSFFSLVIINYYIFCAEKMRGIESGENFSPLKLL
jgi:hypothetical protein